MKLSKINYQKKLQIGPDKQMTRSRSVSLRISLIVRLIQSFDKTPSSRDRMLRIYKRSNTRR
ncbi:hypothetical protein BpHYR1_054186 [Brachionus plicatilis]|uniref:Uncharacterized protein n=1 Tax=Brachionus plicatilis TaxID=10195 RepID=A0A3M7Q621_BRAPC|nr:hypothetical protein BpHYR1_054186 [Brachionus plicatilis]